MIYWLALYGSTLAFNLNTATTTLAVASNTWVIEQSTSGIRRNIEYVIWNVNPQGEVIESTNTSMIDDLQWKAWRVRQQGLSQGGSGLTLTLRAGTPVQNPITWTRLSGPKMLLHENSNSSQSFAVSQSSTQLMGYVNWRRGVTGEIPNVYRGNELGVREDFNVWVYTK